MMVGSMGDSEVGVEGVVAPPVRGKTSMMMRLVMVDSEYWSDVTKQTSHLDQLIWHNPVELLVLRDDQAGGGWGGGV